MSRLVAVTGATGFVGRHAVAELARQGWRVRLLARSEPAHALWHALHPEVVLGSLQQPAALQRLVQGADAVLHLAGAIKARNEQEFFAINRDGTANLAQAVQQTAPEAHFLHVSSLAAREPHLSGYAASKHAGEVAAFEALGAHRVSIIRPPAVYGPGDRETLVFFQLARQRLIPLLGSPTARIALIHVHDVARALAAQLQMPPSGCIQGLADDSPQGYSWREILTAAATAVGNNRPRFVQMHPWLLQGIGQTAGVAARLMGQAAMFNPGKLRELLHEDWSAPADTLLKSTASKPQYTLLEGFRTTAEWYRQARWLHA